MKPPSGPKKQTQNKPNFRILRLASTAFFIKFLVEANPKDWRREPADKKCVFV